MNETARILIVEDKPADADLAKYTIQKVLRDCEFQVVETRQDFLHALERFQPDVIISDYSLPRFDGMKALKLVLEHAPVIPLIIWTGLISEDVAVECMKAGANNYIPKENIKRLGPAVIHALEERQLSLERTQVEEKYQNIIENSPVGIFQSTPAGRYLNVNPAMARLYGYDSPKEMIELVKHIADQIYVDPDRRKEFISLLDSVNIVENYEERNYRKDGSIIWTSTSARAVRNPQADILYYEGFVQDVTQRKKVEEALQNNEKRFRALIENGLDNISLLKADGTLIWESPAAIRMLAYAPDEFVGRDIFALMHPDDLEWTRSVYATLLQEPGSHRRGAFRLRRSDGTWRWVDAIVTNMLGEPSVDAVVVNYRDITEQKQAEEALRESQAKYRNLVETSHDLIWSVDAEGKITFLNRAAKEIYGYEPEELVGHSFFEVMDSGHYHQKTGSFAETIGQADEFREVETYVRHRDGREIILSANSIVMRDERGKIIGMTGSSRDVTLRKRVEDVLKEERNLLRTLIDNIPDRIYAMDLEGRKTLSNTADWKASGGKTMEDIIGKTDFETYPPELAEQFWKLDQHVLDSGEPLINFEEPGLDFEGHLVSVLTTKIPLRDSEGKVIGLVGVGRDITERKQAEEALRQSEARYRTLVETQTEFIVRWKQDGTRTFVNEAYCNYFGLTAEQAISGNFMPLILEEDRPAIEEKIHRLTTGVTNVETEIHRVVQRNGQIGWQEWTDQVVRNDHGEVIEFQSVGRDITERKQAEEGLRQSENRYRLALKATNDVIWEWNPEAHQLLWSENAHHVFGYPAEEIGPNEKWWDDHIHPDDRDRVLTKLNALIDGNGSLWMEEYRFRLNDGSYAYIGDRAYIERDENGAPLRMIGAMSDITSRRESEIERQALLEIMQGFANTTDVQELLELVHHSLAKVIYAENFFVILYQAEDGLFEEIYSVDQYDPPAPPDKLGKSITSYIFRTGEPLLLTQKSFDELVARGEIELIGTNSASWLGVPLKTSGRTIGVIAVQDYENDNRYSERDKEFLASIASQIALAIERKQANIELKQKNDDLGLLHAINEAIVRGENLDSIVELLAKELRRIFSVQGSAVYSTLYMLTPDKQSIQMRNYVFSSEIANRIEKLIGFSIPMIEIPVKEGGFFHQAMISRRSAIATEPVGIRSWITEFTETKFLPPLARAAIRKLIPQIQKLLNINSMIIVPLISEEETIGFLGISGSGYFTIHDQKRIENIAGQLTAVMQWQRAEEDLRTSNERFNLMSKAVNDAIWDWDFATNQVRWNDAFHSLFKYDLNKVDTNEKWWIENIHPEDRDRIVSSLQNAIESKTASNWKNEYRFRRADGSYSFIFDRGYIIRDRSEKAIRMVGAMQDITERKQAEDALHRSEALYRQAMEVAGAVPYYESYYDEGRLIKYEFIGEGIRQITGYGPEEFSAPLWDSLVEEVNLIEDLAGYSLDEGIKRVRSGQNPIWKCEHRLRDRNGNIHWVFEAAVELRDENGVSHGSIGTYQDITTRKQAETAEREQRALAEALRDTAETLSSSLSYEEVLDHILAAVGRVVPHDAATVMLTDEDCARVVRSYGYAQRGFNFEVMGVRLPMAGTTNLRQMFETRQPVIVYDTHTYPGWIRLPAINWLRSNVGAPIIIQEKIIGFILLDSQTPGFFTPVHAERLEAFANQAALAIHNARLLQQAQEEIAERKQAEAQLRASEERFRQLADNIQEAFWMTDAENGEEIYMSPAAESIWGRSTEVLMHEPDAFINSVFPEDQPAILQAIEKEKRGERVEIEYRIVRPDGSVRWIWDRAFPIFDETGKVTRIAGISADITERREAELALIKSQSRYHELFDSSPISIWEEDYSLVKKQLDFLLECGIDDLREYFAAHPHKVAELASLVKVTDINKASLELYQVEHREDLLDSLTEAMGAEPISHFDQEILGLISPSKRFTWEGADKAINGRHLEVIVNGSIPEGYEDDWSKVIVSIIDITERRQAEQQLRKLSRAVEQSASTIVITDVRGNIEYVNPKFTEITGYALEEVIGQNPRLLKSGRTPEQDYVKLWQTISGGHEWRGELLNKKKDGSLFWESVTISPVLNERGLITHFVGVKEDITERKHAEEEIRRRVEETSALLETSLALTRLDLKATLQTIGNSAKALFAADGCRVFLTEPDGKSLRCVMALQENFVAFSNLKIKVGEGVTGAVAASGQAEIVNEMQNDPRSVQVPGTQDKEPEAIMFAPLKERNSTIGVLSIRRAGAERPFQPADLGLLEAFASMAASAVSNARLFEETQRRLAELEALYENGLAVGRLLKTSEIGNRVINTFARYLQWHHVTIRLRKEETDGLELVAFNLPGLTKEEKAEMEKHFASQIKKVRQGLSGWVIQTGMPFRTGNVHSHPQYMDIQPGIQSGLYMPLKVGEQAIGVISVESEVPDAFTEQDERLLATLANQAAIAFENARLYEAIQKELSERKRAEQALRASEVHYRELADSITDILFELDQDLRYTHWNRASEIFSGIPAQEVIGKLMQEVFRTSEEQLGREETYKSVLKERRARTFETEALAKGQKRALEITAYPSARGVSVVAKDVTERKRSEIIMQKRFELMEFSAHHSLQELMQKTIDEVCELTDSTIGFLHFVDEDEVTLGLQTWSTEALRDFQVPSGEGHHRALDQAGVWAEAARQRRPLIQNDYESLSHKRGVPQGHVPIARELVIPIIRNERIMAVMGIANKMQEYHQADLEITARLADYAWDITERKQMELTLEAERNQLARRVDERTADLSRANSNLARALRVKDEFLANMSHELRTPLNAILGLSESLSEQIAGPLNEKQQKYISTISESGHHLLSLINDILDLAKIDAGQITLDINKVDIRSVCQASLRMIKQLAQKKHQEVSLEIDEALGLMWADERRLKQMLVNLLGNAVKFTPDNGKLGLEVHGDEEANKISFTVWDNGVGIREEDLARLFQPFVQLDSGLARETTGTGLGLALVAQMARLHGGSIQAVSKPENGSRFTVVLPWEPALAMDAATRMKITGKFRAIKLDEQNKPTILLVEDTQEVTMMIKDYLELAGYKVITAQDGVDAIVQAKLVRPDLILMDVQMPRMDGLEATRKLRSEPNFRYTPIIALTALAMSGDRERCLEAGMDEYISKPVNLKALIKIIQGCLFSNQEVKSR